MNATGMKMNSYSNRRTEEFGYEPLMSSLDSVVYEAHLAK